MWIVMAMVGVLVGAIPGGLMVRHVRRLHVAQDEILADDVPAPGDEPADLTADELAYLSGGPERVAQVALAELFLDDRIEGTEHGLRLVPGTRAAAHDGPRTLRRTMTRQLAAQGTMGVRELAVTALATSGGPEAWARDLQERGLCRDLAVVRRAWHLWEPTRRLGRTLGLILALLTIAVWIALAIVAPVAITAVVTAALGTCAAACLWGAGRSCDAKALLSPRTPAGDAAVDAAAAEISPVVRALYREVPDDERGVVLRDVAVRGFGGTRGAFFSHKFTEYERRPPLRRTEVYGTRPHDVVSQFVEWCLFRNWSELREAQNTKQPFDRAPTQELWDQSGLSTPEVVDKGSLGNWRLLGVYQFRDTTINHAS